MNETNAIICPDVNDASAKGAAVYLSTIGFSAFLVLPLLVGAAADDLNLNASQIGYLAAMDFAGAAVGSVLALFWVRRANWRVAGSIALTILGCANLISLLIDAFLPLLSIRFVAGLGAGSVLSLSLTALSDTRNPDHGFGLSVAAQVTFMVAGFLILPFVVEVWGVDGIYFLLGVLVLSSLITVRWLPPRGVIQTTPSTSKLSLNPKSILGLAGCTMFSVNVGCIWTYLERMGVAAGFTSKFIGTGLATAVAVGIVGGLTASWLRDRYGRLRPLAVATLGTVVSVAMLAEGMGPITYIIAAGIYNFVWNFALPYQYAAISTTDSSGRLIVLVPAFQTAGMSIGPAIAALFITGESYLAVNYIAAMSVIISLVLFVPICRQQQRFNIHGSTPA